MPVEGFKSLTLPEELYAKLREVALKNSRSPAKQIEYFLKKSKEI